MAVYCKVGHLDALLVPHLYSIEAAAAALPHAAGFGNEGAAFGSGKKLHGDLLGDGDPVAVGVGGHGKGEVGKVNIAPPIGRELEFKWRGLSAMEHTAWPGSACSITAPAACVAKRSEEKRSLILSRLGISLPPLGNKFRGKRE